jgi:hypothetical protein
MVFSLSSHLSLGGSSNTGSISGECGTAGLSQAMDFTGNKNPQHTFLQMGKPEVPCRKILWHVKDLLKSHRDVQTKFSFPSPTPPLAPEMCWMAGSPDSTGGYRRRLC